ncbi:MAG: amidohydrolase, partial [Dehalococcoidales bacterium]|nr:amidohydrolase [Dehalococcoidales bacterium]
ALVEPDPVLEAAKLPLCTQDELPGYSWARSLDGRPNKEVPMKIDIYSHILPPKFTELYARKYPAITKRVEYRTRAVVDLEVRIRLMERYPDVLQVLTVANIPLETFASPADAVELARIANEELAELVERYPNRFVAGVACLPMNDVDAAIAEAERAITRLGLKGIQVYSRINGEPLDSPRFKPLWAKMAEHDLPVWIHPATNDRLDNDIGVFSWPYETSCAMFRLVGAGIFNEHPNLKFIVHHCGAMVPYFSKRIKWVLSLVPDLYPGITRPEEHFRRFYTDTAVYGNTSALMCGYDFFGADHILYGTDFPLGPKFGLTGETLESVARMPIPEAEKEKIFFRNAAELLSIAH